MGMSDVERKRNSNRSSDTDGKRSVSPATRIASDIEMRGRSRSREEYAVQDRSRSKRAKRHKDSNSRQFEEGEWAGRCREQGGEGRMIREGSDQHKDLLPDKTAGQRHGQIRDSQGRKRRTIRRVRMTSGRDVRTSAVDGGVDGEAGRRGKSRCRKASMSDGKMRIAAEDRVVRGNKE